MLISWQSFTVVRIPVTVSQLFLTETLVQCESEWTGALFKRIFKRPSKQTRSNTHKNNAPSATGDKDPEHAHTLSLSHTHTHTHTHTHRAPDHYTFIFKCKNIDLNRDGYLMAILTETSRLLWERATRRDALTPERSCCRCSKRCVDHNGSVLTLVCRVARVRRVDSERNFSRRR